MPEMTPLYFLLGRRSATALGEPGPSPEQLELILRAATTVPDHGLLRPYRFVVAQGEAREALGRALAEAGREADPALPPAAYDKLRAKAFAAPTLVLVIFSPKESARIPRWEQQVSASCTGYAMILAAAAQGLGAVWKSSPFQEGKELRTLLGMREDEQLLGWINVGQPLRQPPDRAPVDLATLATHL